MPSRTWSLIIAIVVVFTGSIVFGQSTPQGRQTIPIEDIFNGKVVIVGQLGKPIGEALTVLGRWEQPIGQKDFSLQFVVRSVNGVKLTKAVSFAQTFVHLEQGARAAEIRPKDGDVWEVVAIEELVLHANARFRTAIGYPSAQDYNGWQSILRCDFKTSVEAKEQESRFS